MLIVGAGMAGCLAAIVHKESKVIDNVTPKNTHQAVFRLRRPDIGDITGIPLKKVKIYKGIWYHGGFVEPNPKMIALYSRKVSDYISPRSITNVNDEIRYIPPEDFHEQMFNMISDRFEERPLTEKIVKENDIIVSTIPIKAIAGILGKGLCAVTAYNSIYVNKYYIENCDYYATVYYPHPEVLPYRATINGSTLTIESTYPLTDKSDIQPVFDSLGMLGVDINHTVKNYVQPIGKLVPMDEKLRRKFITDITDEYGIYSLGRFATWRNILLDDILKDIYVIGSLISKDLYGRRLAREN